MEPRILNMRLFDYIMLFLTILPLISAGTWDFQFPMNYSRRQRPLTDQSVPIKVQYKITIIQLIALDEKQQEMCCKVWIDQKWHDDYIKWNRSNDTEYRPEWMAFRPGEIWTPDIAIDNSISVERENFDIKVYQDGSVWWSIPAIIRTTCYIKTEHFPFDKQECDIVVGSWYYPPNELNLVVQENATKMELKYVAPNAQWEFLDSWIYVNDEKHDTYDMVFRTLMFKIKFKRKSLYYCLILIVPYVLISFVSVANFILPCESGEKIALGVTVLLSQFVNLLNLVDLIPESSDSFPVLGLYYLFSMALCALSVILTVIILNIHFQAENSKRLPSLLRTIFLQYLRVLLLPGTRYEMIAEDKPHVLKLNMESKNTYERLCRSKSRYPKSKQDRIFLDSDDHFEELNNHCNNNSVGGYHRSSCEGGHSKKNHVIKNSALSLQNHYSHCAGNTRNCVGIRDSSNLDLPILTRESEYSSPFFSNNGTYGSASPVPVTDQVTGMRKMSDLLTDIRDTMDTLIQNKNSESRDSAISEEWRIAARVLDRILGILYCITFCSVFAFLDYDVVNIV